MVWFKDCRNVTECKALYRRLAMEHHPDRGGDTQTMQAINAEYHAALQRLDGSHSRDEAGNQHEYHYHHAVEQAVMDKLDELLRARLGGCDVWLIGTWIWVTGNTRAHKGALKSANLCWHSKRKAWYWHPYHYARTRYNASIDLAGLAAVYGVRQFSASSDAPIAAG